MISRIQKYRIKQPNFTVNECNRKFTKKIEIAKWAHEKRLTIEKYLLLYSTKIIF